jgi:hypothetical protein
MLSGEDTEDIQAAFFACVSFFHCKNSADFVISINIHAYWRAKTWKKSKS